MVLYPEAEVRLYDAGRFALENYAQEMAGAIRDFLDCRVLRRRLLSHYDEHRHRD